MSFKRMDKRGVSEVVGTILILLMTVVLFSTIILWVTGLPTPQASTRLDMEGKFTPLYAAGVWNGGTVTITHRGGETLHDYRTRIYLTINGRNEVLKLRGTIFDGFGLVPYGINGNDNDWNIGETWTYTNHSIPQNPAISVIIADTERSAVLWEQDIVGFPGTQPPLFLEKWTDADPGTPTRDPVQPGDNFTIYARVTDPDGDLRTNSVYAAFTFGGLGTLRLYDDGTNGDAQAGDGVFTRNIFGPAQKAWDGGVVVFNATDLRNHQTQSRFIMSVIDLGGGMTPATGPLSLTKFNDLQGYDFFNKTAWDALRWSAKPTRIFRPGETVVAVVVSQYLVDLGISNQFLVYDTTSGSQNLLVYGGGSLGTATRPSSSAAFTFDGSEAGYNIFIYQFSTRASDYGYGGTQMNPGRYPVTIDLKSAKVDPPRNRFYVNDYISVTDANGRVPNYPAIQTYKDAAMTQPANVFSFTQTMYVKITVRSTDASFSVGTVRMQDFIGDVQVQGTPGTSPVSFVQINSTTTYKFSVDLSKPNLDAWLFGNNSYTLAVLNIRDADESYDFLSTQTYILGPRWNLDAVIGYCAPQDKIGKRNYGDTVFGTFYANQLGWDPTFIDTFPGNFKGCKWRRDAPTNPITAMALGDLDADSDLDIAAGQDISVQNNRATGVVEWFRNTNGLGFSTGGNPWEKIQLGDTLCGSGVAPPCITAIAVGHINRDPLLDIAVGTSTGEIWWYANDGTWSAHLVASLGVKIKSLKLADLNGDKTADMVVGLDTNTNSIRVYINDGTGVFGNNTETITSGCCLMAADSGGLSDPGFIGNDLNPPGPAPQFQYTRSSNDQRETIQERLVNYSGVAGETWASPESVQGSYVNVTSLDGQYETITEGTSGNMYTLDSAGTPSGHRWSFTNVWALTTDRIELHIFAGLQSPGTEAFAVRWSTSPTGSGTGNNAWNAVRDAGGANGVIDSQTFGEYVFSFSPVSDIRGGTIYISVVDTDRSNNDGNSDRLLTSLQVDYVYLLTTRATGTTSAATHIWTTATITSGQDAYKFFVEGFHTSNGEGDDFVFRYATSIKGPYVDLLTMRAQDFDSTVSVGMDPMIGGRTLYILVEDLDHTVNRTGLDTVKIDYMYVNGYKANPTTYYPPNPGVPTNSIAIADIDKDGRADIVAGLNTNKVHVYWNQGDGKSYTSPDVLNTPATVNDVDVGYISGSVGALFPDTRLDIAVAMNSNQIWEFDWNGVRGSWSAKTLFTLSTDTAVNLRVGDVDGDYWDDVVLTTSGFSLYYLRNNNRVGTGFDQTLIDFVNGANAIYDLDIGDVDRGVLATYATL